jgi:hypothetical protein
MAMVLTGQKPTQRAHYGECSEGLPGSTKSVGCVERNARNLGDPSGSWTPKMSGASTQEKRIVCHIRGNPETEVGRTLNVDEQTRVEGGPGRQS